MNTNAIYIIREDEKEFYFRSKYAGGFSYPFEAAGYLNSLKYALKQTRIREQNIYVAPLLAQMRGTCCFPDSLRDTKIFCVNLVSFLCQTVQESSRFLEIRGFFVR